MLGRQHALSGVLAGMGLAGAVPDAPVVVRVLAVAVCGGAALLPDLDHPNATASRSLGPVTAGIAVAVDAASCAVYHATRGPRDSDLREGGHRTLTHTLAVAATVGGAVCKLAQYAPLGLAVLCGLLAGLLGLGLSWAGGPLGLAGLAGGVHVALASPSWMWVVALAVTIGWVVHLLGDAITVSGVPLLWPLLRRGRRWGRVRTLVTFEAGGRVELWLVRPLLVASLVAAGCWTTGLLPALSALPATVGTSAAGSGS